MVQLKYIRWYKRKTAAIVLIPVWCNWNKFDYYSEQMNAIGFNSCMVQLKSREATRTYGFFNSFNSCMVQLKLVWGCRLALSRHVLIPVWCNWNYAGFYASSSIYSVLIPVWCNWNAWMWSPCWKKKHVLIPVWCNWNSKRISRDNLRLLCFNSCMVQLKYVETTQLLPPAVSFNSCMVQLKLCRHLEMSMFLQRFNSCMVQLKSYLRAYAARRRCCFNSCMVQLKYFSTPPTNHFGVVLIPVWCNWNFVAVSEQAKARKF